MTGADVQELTFDDLKLTLLHDKVKQHFKAGIEFFDEELGPARILANPGLLAAFVNAAAMESLASALSKRPSAE